MKKIILTAGLLLISSSMFYPVLAKNITLSNGSWNIQTKQKLEKLLNANVNKGKKVIFDFDNTIVSGDIGDATFAWLIKEKQVDLNKIKAISPDFTIDGKKISIGTATDPTEYYEKIMEAYSYDKNDITGPLIGYSWVVQTMDGKTPFNIIEASRNAYMDNKSANDRQAGTETIIEVTPGKTAYKVPFYRPETVNLIGNLILNGFDVYIVSASNVWSVRYMITKELTKLMKKEFGKNLSIKPENIYGINTLVRDKRNGQLYKDSYLVKNNRKYASLDSKELSNYELTNQLVNPLSGYEGKTSIIQNFITKKGEKPFLVAGDSPGDFSMLTLSENRLWFARLESYNYQKKIISLIKENKNGQWFIQPILYKKKHGLVNNMNQLKKLLNDNKDFIKASDVVSLLEKSFLLKDFGK